MHVCSAMSLESTELGLRALYGTLSVMNPLINTGNRVPVFTLGYFIHIFKNYEGLSLVDAVDVLRVLYGTDRRVLVMVDEISKATPIGADARVMTTLGTILDQYDMVDVLISSLSPQYITNLATGSNRYIDYVTMAALIDSGLGQNQCIEWARIMTKNVSGGSKLYLFNILKSAYLLLSGHPRSIEYLVESFTPYYEAERAVEKDVSEVGVELVTLPSSEVTGVWQPLLEMISRRESGSVIIGEIIRTINRIGNIQYNTKTVRSTEILEFILRCDDMYDEDLLRQYSELGVVFASTLDAQKCAMRLGEFLSDLNLYINRPAYSSKVTPQLCRLGAAMTLFTDAFKVGSGGGISLDVSDLWEYSICLTIFCKAFDRACVFGIMHLIPQCAPLVRIRRAAGVKDLGIGRATSVQDELVVSPKGFAGFDARITFVDKDTNKNIFVYTQMKVAAPTSTSLVNIYIKAIVNILLHHLRIQGPSFDLSNVFIVFYVWSDIHNPVAAIAEAVALMPAYLKTLPTTTTKLTETKAILSYLNTYGVSNIHVLGKAQLDGWLIPTLKPIPRFVESANSIPTIEGS